MTAPATDPSDALPQPAGAPVANVSGRNLRSAAYLIGGQVAVSACTFGIAVVAARSLGAAGKGYYDIIVSSAALLATFTGLSIGSGIFYHVAARPLDHHRLIRVLTALAAVAGLVVLAMLQLAGGSPVLRWLLPAGERGDAVVLIAILLALTHAYQVAQAVAKGQGRFGWLSLADVLARGGAFVAVLVLALMGVRSPGAFLVALAGATLAAVLLLVLDLLRIPAPAGSVPWRAVIGYSLPLFLGNAVQFLNYRVDVFFVQTYLGLREVGLYTVAVGLAQILWLVPNSLASLVMRAAAQAQGDEVGVLWRVALVNRFCVWLSLAAGVLMLLGAQLVIVPVFGRGFGASLAPLALLLPGVIAFAQTVVLSAYLNGVARQALTTKIAVAALVITLVLDVVLIPRFGIVGAALASSASYAFSSVLTLAVVYFPSRVVPLHAYLLPQRHDLVQVRDLWRRLQVSSTRARPAA